MTAEEDRTILLIGSGPIKIGQAAEFDYSGAQACRALQEEGARVVLVNSNPATIMTDPDMADKVYLEPINTEAITEVIRKENPDGVIAGLGGQTGLNVTAELAEEGVLDEYDVDVMGTPLDTIYATEDRDLFRQRMEKIGEPVPRSTTISLDEGESVTDFDEANFRQRIQDAVDEVGGLPVIARTTYTLGGSGSGVVDDFDDLGLIMVKHADTFGATSVHCLKNLSRDDIFRMDNNIKARALEQFDNSRVINDNSGP